MFSTTIRHVFWEYGSIVLCTGTANWRARRNVLWRLFGICGTMFLDGCYFECEWTCVYFPRSFRQQDWFFYLLVVKQVTDYPYLFFFFVSQPGIYMVLQKTVMFTLSIIRLFRNEGSLWLRVSGIGCAYRKIHNHALILATTAISHSNLQLIESFNA
jgi:hypothetical protein